MIGPLIGGLIAGGIGGLICYWTVIGLLRQQERRLAGRIAQGTVTEIRTDRSMSDDNYDYPVVQFTTESGQPVQFESSIRETPLRFKVNEAVRVAYDPANPSAAEIDGVDTVPLVLLLILLGIPLLLIGIGLVIHAFTG